MIHLLTAPLSSGSSDWLIQLVTYTEDTRILILLYLGYSYAADAVFLILFSRNLRN
jgi:hypothetical protein